MHLPVFAFIGLRYAKSSKSNHFIAFINFFSVMGIALGLMALITVTSVMNGFEGQLKNKILGLMPHIVVDTRQQSQKDPVNFLSIPGVLHQSPLIEMQGVLQAKSGLKGVMIQGVDAEQEVRHSIVPQSMLQGDFDSLQPGSYGLVIGRALAIQLGLQVGEQVRVIAAGTSVYTPFGRMPSQRKFTVAGVYDLGSELDEKVVLMNIQDAARLMRQGSEQVTQTRLVLADAFAYQQVEQHISLPTDNWRSRQGPLFDAVKMEKNMMALMLLLIIAVAAFNIVSALVMVVTEKHGDIAILRTQGMPTSSILGIFLFTGVYNGLKGTLIGLVCGLLLVSQLNNLLELLGVPLNLSGDGSGLPIDIDWVQIGGLAVLAISLSFLATLYPAFRAIRVQPARALQYE